MAAISEPFFTNPAFKKSFADVPIEDGKISTQAFIEACETLLLIFDYLASSAFGLVKKDISGNVEKIKARYNEAPAESATLQDLVINELKTKKHTATEGLLWLTRGLEFLSLALNANLEKENEELADSFKNAYGTTLKPHHSFVIKPIFTAAMSACPYRKDFYANVKKNQEEASFQAQMRTYLQALQEDVNILKPFVNSKEAKW